MNATIIAATLENFNLNYTMKVVESIKTKKQFVAVDKGWAGAIVFSESGSVAYTESEMKETFTNVAVLKDISKNSVLF